MAYCPQCGSENPISHRACTTCGTHLQSGQTPGAFGDPGADAWQPTEARQSAALFVESSPTPQAGTLAQPQVSYPQRPAMANAAEPRVPSGYPAPLGPPPAAGEDRGRRGTDPARLGGEAASTFASAQPHSSRGRLIGFLVSYDVNPQGTYYPLHTGTLRLGRKDAAPSLDVAIEHPTVSSNHALFYFDSARHVAQLEDTESANGTLLNDAPIAGTGKREVRDGDRIRFGAFKAILKLVEHL